MTRYTWRLTYPDGSVEEVAGYSLLVHDSLLTIEQGFSSFNRMPRSWPISAIRSWEQLS